MKTFAVSVEKKMYQTGIINVEAESENIAIIIVQKKIIDGLQTAEVTWNHPEYEDFSFQTTGDVDEVE